MKSKNNQSSDLLYTPSGVRLRRRRQRTGRLNWLLLPGGPGIGSESLTELANLLDVSGTVWLVDLPGDGDNVAPPDAGGDLYARWPGILIEAAEAMPYCVYVGHSTGGMYLLATPALEKHIVGLVLISSAPDARWQSTFVQMADDHPLPAVDEATDAFEKNETNENLRDIAVASTEWNFTATNVEFGRQFLARMPYNVDAVDWSERHFDMTYVAQWWPATTPTLVLSGDDDRIVDQTLWNDDRFHGPNVLHRTIANAAHFCWLENPDAVAAAFSELESNIDAQHTHT